MTTYKIGCGRLYAGKRITIDKSHMVSSFQLIGYKTAQRCTYQYFSIARSLDFTTSHSYSLVQINLTCQEESSEEDNRCWIYCPNHLAFVYRVDVVHLYAYITCRTRTVEYIEFYVLNLATPR